jgi:hypothetical protein
MSLDMLIVENTVLKWSERTDFDCVTKGTM